MIIGKTMVIVLMKYIQVSCGEEGKLALLVDVAGHRELNLQYENSVLRKSL